MECIKDLKATFVDKGIALDASYHFINGVKIKIEVEIKNSNIGAITAKQIQEAPIRLAISQLQSLLASEETTESQ
jgi:hypothetical protein